MIENKTNVSIVINVISLIFAGISWVLSPISIINPIIVKQKEAIKI